MTSYKQHIIKYSMIGVWAAAILMLSIALWIFIQKKIEAEDQAEYEESLVDLADKTEELYPNLAEATKNDPNRNYTTTTTQSKYTEVLGKYLFDSKEENPAESLKDALASGAGILIQKKVYQEDFTLDSQKDFKSLESNVLEKYGINIISTKAMNANILNYYLDKGCVVVFFAKGESPYSEDGRAILVFGGYLIDGVYITFSPIRDYESYDDTRTRLIPKTTLFQSIQSEEQFYILEVAKGDQ